MTGSGALASAGGDTAEAIDGRGSGHVNHTMPWVPWVQRYSKCLNASVSP